VKAVRGRGDARWLPSRHRFALFRLFAYLRLLAAKPEPRPGLILIIDRDQTAYEHHLVSLWIAATSTFYLAATLFRGLPVPVAIAAAIPVAALALEVPFYVSGLLLRRGSRVNGIVCMLVLAIASLYVVRQPSWVRFVAWQFFAVIALNATAAAIVFLLRAPIARLERGFVFEG
jgi:hypothetical protein